MRFRSRFTWLILSRGLSLSTMCSNFSRYLGALVLFSTFFHIIRNSLELHSTQRSRRLISRLNFSQTGTGPSTDPSALKGGKSVVSEFYDEIIFQDPTQYIQVHPYIAQTSPDQYSTIILQPLLTTTRQLTMGAHKHETDFEVGNRTSKLDEKVPCNLIKQPFLNS